MTKKLKITEPTVITVRIPSGNDVPSVIRNAVRFCKSFSNVALAFTANNVPMRVTWKSDEGKAIQSFRDRHDRYNT